MIPNISLSALAERYPNGICHFVCRAGFETRSLSVAKALFGVSKSHVWIFRNPMLSPRIEKHLKALREGVDYAREIIVDIDNPNDIADSMRELAEAIQQQPQGVRSVIDITTFRREELLILLRMLAYFQGDSHGCDLAYVGASKFSDEWLTHGTVMFRSVIGYSGDSLPSRPTHLVVMLGFELERARDIIENYEPTRLSVGCGTPHLHADQEFYARNKQLATALKTLYGRQFAEFEFAVDDPLSTKSDLARVVDPSDGYNHIIAPLNNKLSTIGAGLLALDNSAVQICYGVAGEYNEDEYSEPGDSASVLDLSYLQLPSDI